VRRAVAVSTLAAAVSRTGPPAWDLLEPAGVRVSTRPGAAPVVRICGELDLYSAPQLRDELLRAVRRHGPRLCLDLGDVTFLDCAGVSVLLAARRRARLQDGWIRISHASPRARRTLTLLGLQQAFQLGTPALPTAAPAANWIAAGAPGQPSG